MAARRTKIRGRLAGPFFVLIASTIPMAAQKPETAAPIYQTRPEVKCRAYVALWEKTIAARGLNGLGAEFRERHAAFIAGGCTGVHDVCPRSPGELDLANVMVLHSMNAGMASTFAPFGCPK